MSEDAFEIEDGRQFPTRPLVGIGVVLFRGDAVLLVRRARPPLAGAWSFPGGAQELGETAEDAARRELREETGMAAAGALRLAAHVDAIHRDEAGRVMFHYTILDFAGHAAGGIAPRAGGDVSAASFVAFDALAACGLDAAHRAVAARARAVLDAP